MNKNYLEPGTIVKLSNDRNSVMVKISSISVKHGCDQTRYFGSVIPTNAMISFYTEDIAKIYNWEQQANQLGIW